MLALTFLLSACGGGEQNSAEEQQAAQYWEALQNAQCEVKILSNLGQQTLEYTLEYAYNKEGSDDFTILEPEPLAGITASIAGDEAPALTLQYEDTILDAPGPTQPGVTPADAVPYLLYTLRASSPAETWKEQADGNQYTVLKYIEDGSGGRITRQIWLNGMLPAYAEVYADGTRVLALTFANWVNVE